MIFSRRLISRYIPIKNKQKTFFLHPCSILLLLALFFCCCCFFNLCQYDIWLGQKVYLGNFTLIYEWLKTLFHWLLTTNTTNIYYIMVFKIRDIVLPSKVHIDKAMFFFPVIMYGCESWTTKETEHRKIDGAGKGSWESLAQQGDQNQSILKEISTEYLLEDIMPRLKP